MLDGDAHVGTRHRQPPHDIQAGGIFATRAAQEFAPRGDTREQILDDHTRSFGERRGPFADQRAIVDDAPPAVAVRRPAFQRQPRDARDRRQSLSPESQCRHRLDRFVGELRRRVAFKRERHVGGGHAATVILDLQPRDPALADSHGNPSRARVDGVFNQFLERRGGSFNHFTGCDPIYELFRQAAY